MGVARSRESCVACGRTSRQTRVVTTVGSRIPARSAVALSMHPTQQVGRRGWCVVTRRSACSKAWMQLRQMVPKTRRDVNRKVAHRQPHLLLLAFLGKLELLDR